MSSDKNHSEQYEKYLKGEISSEEANSFERKTLSDPFAQEALEGLEAHDPKLILSDIKELKDKISIKSKKGIAWMQIAAVVALLVVGSLTLWLLNQVQIDNQEELATQEEAIQKSVENITSDSLTKKESQELIAEAVPILDKVKKVKKDGVKVVDRIELNDEEREEIKEAEVEPVMTLAEAEVSVEEITEETEIGPVGILTQEADDMQVAEAVPQGFQLNEINNEKLDSNLLTQSLVANDNSEETNLNNISPVLSKRKMSSQSRSTSAPLSDVSSSDLEEIVITDVESEKKTLGYASNKIEDFNKAKPVISNRKYVKYLNENLQYPEEAKINNIEGTVEIELTILQNGELANIDIKKSLGYGCDEEAIRLVREGPHWKAAEREGERVEDKVIVEVTFKL